MKVTTNYEFFEINELENGRIIEISLNNPQKGNSFNQKFWDEFPRLINEIESTNCIVVVVNAKGDNFSYGLDLMDLIKNNNLLDNSASGRENLIQFIKTLQKPFQFIHNSSKVYIACVKGYCIGAGLDLISACDIRVASQSAKVSLRESKMGIVADLGSLYFLPHIIGLGNTKMMAFTSKDYTATECFQMGLFQSIYETDEGMHGMGLELAQSVLECSPIALRGVKKNIRYGLNHNMEDSFDYVATWNASFLMNLDLNEALQAFTEKRKPVFKT